MILKQMPFTGLFLLTVSLSALFPTEMLGQTWTKVWEEPVVIPTYRIGAPDRDPIFYGGRSYQGAKGAVYPYALMDKITDERENKTYKGVYLENQYIKISVLPEIGGRIFSAQDKTNGYDFFYHQHVIKPALVGMLGAWISGGVEWNIPHHHRASTYMPVDYTLQENPDGSKTVWIGEMEIRHRMKWIVGLTIYPDKAYIEATVKLFNRTPFAHSFLYFANVAVHANQDYQVIFPPRTEIATFHAKDEFLRWPISDRDFHGLNFGHPVDVSWWKNHPSPTSWFAFNSQEDFFGGYDHGKHAGVVHFADHHIVPGKKFWEWGNGDEGRMWDRILTETDGPYIELMAGAFSDNQPDYSWIQPYEVKTWKQYWYPIRELGGIKNANLDAAVNLEVNATDSARIAFNTTSEFCDAHVVLQNGEQTLFEQRIDIGPEKPFVKDVALAAGVKEDDLKVLLFTSSGRELISYIPVKLVHPPLPDPVKPPLPPKDIKTVEGLYLAGLRLQQFYNPALRPDAYYEEALRRDPGNDRVNTELGILSSQRGMFTEAEEHLRKALARITRDYTSPKDGEPFYYLGVALAGQGKFDEAYDAFYKATWTWAWNAAGYYQLARLACMRREYAQALEFLGRSIDANSLDTSARDLRAAVLRHMGKLNEAAKLAAESLTIDPLDFWAGNETYLAKSASGQSADADTGLRSLKVMMRGDAQAYLELAVDYGNGGFADEAAQVLTRYVDLQGSQAGINPMVYYYLGYFSELKGDREAASNYYQRARQSPPDYCFPFRLESIFVLRRAIRTNPRDARAHYYLGNLLYDRQPQEAIKEWEASRALDDSFAIVHRNLGLAYAQVEKNLPKAIASYERAVECDSKDARLFYETDRLSEEAGIPAEKRLARLESHQQTIQERDDAVYQEVSLYVQVGQYDKALEILKRRHFHAAEGEGEVHTLYVNAHLLRGAQRLKSGQAPEALADFQAALEYPANLEVGRPYHVPREAEINYLVGTAHEALGDEAQAKSSYEKAVAEAVDVPEIRYFQALAFGKLGRQEQAANIFNSLLDEGRKECDASADLDYFAKFGEQRSEATRLAHAHYLMGLGYLGQGKRAEAKAEFEQVLKRNPNHLGAITQLAALDSQVAAAATHR